MLIIPAIVPSVLAAYSVVGEREQGTLEPVLITPIRREEFLVGKALAVLVPTLAIAYLVFGIFLGIAALFAHPGVASAVFERSHLLVQLLFTPLLAGWSIWVGIAISARSVDVRAAQQLGTLASLPPLAIVALMSLNVITPDPRPGARPRRRAAGRRRSRMAGGGGHVRPGAARHRWANLTVPIFEPSAQHPGTTREKGEVPVAATLQLVREKTSLWSFDVARSASCSTATTSDRSTRTRRSRCRSSQGITRYKSRRVATPAADAPLTRPTERSSTSAATAPDLAPLPRVHRQARPGPHAQTRVSPTQRDRDLADT